MNPPSVSVIVPAYNAEPFLAETLASIVGQTLAPREVIVVDDGSTDATAEVAEAVGPPVRVIRKPNGGVSSSRNRGVQEATGEVLAFCDADDLWEAEKLEAQLDALVGADASACFCGVRDRPMPPPESVTLADLVRHETGRIPAQIPSTLLLPAAAARDVGPWDESLSDAADWDYAIRLRRLGSFCGPTEPLVRYRVHDDAMSRDLELRAADLRRLFDKLEADPELRRALGSELVRARARNTVVMAAGFASEGSWGRALGWLAREGLRHPLAVTGALLRRGRAG